MTNLKRLLLLLFFAFVTFANADVKIINLIKKIPSKRSNYFYVIRIIPKDLI